MIGVFHDDGELREFQKIGLQVKLVCSFGNGDYYSFEHVFMIAKACFLASAHLLPLIVPHPSPNQRLQNDPPSGVTGAPMDTNIMLWQAVIFGPDDTPWEGGTFKLVLEFTEDYPNKAPQVRFLTKMFHPNIYNDGQICLDILQNQWSPIYDISAILTSIQSLLCDPNPASPANSEASRLYNENRREYNRRVREIVEQSWVDES